MDSSVYDDACAAAERHNATSRRSDHRYALPICLSLATGRLIRNQTGNFLSFNDWLDAVDGAYCTSDGGDDLAFDPQFPDPTIVGGFQGHSCGTVKPPLVISNSRADYEYRLSPFYEERQCNEFAKLGLMGVTVLFSSGNVGAAGTLRGYCLDDNGTHIINTQGSNLDL
jgi:tripeptidyl-peptidase-1